MKRNLKKALTYGALALGAYSIFRAANQPAVASTAGLGDWGQPSYSDPSVDPNQIMQVHPGGSHPAHPFWRWWRGAQDANQSTFASPYYGNPQAYNPWSNYWGGGGYGGGESTFGSPYGFDYDAQEIEQAGSLAARSAQYV